MINWKHIMIQQPSDKERIVCFKMTEDGTREIWTEKYRQFCEWEGVLHLRAQLGRENLDFWWVLEKDFPFPDTQLNIKDIEMSMGLCNIARENGIQYLTEFSSMTKNECASLRMMGKKKLEQLEVVLRENGLEFKKPIKCVCDKIKKLLTDSKE